MKRKFALGTKGTPQHLFLIQDILIWAEPYYRAGITTRTKRDYTKKTRNPAQVVIENSDFNQMAKVFIQIRVSIN